MKTLVIDGDNLFKIGLFGVKDYYHQGQHIGGIFHFIHTLRKHLDEYKYDKIVVFWDGNENDKLRREFYPHYKETRKQRFFTEEEKLSSQYQKLRLKQYLEELFVRQGEYDNVEADDSIAFYCQNAPHEEITLFSQDMDLTQLISDHVKMYMPRQAQFLTENDKVELDGIMVPTYNVALVKTICGDDSDNVAGIKGMGLKTLLKHFPGVSDTPTTWNDLYAIAKPISESKKPPKSIQHFVEGTTKHGTYGLEFFDINKKLVDLSHPLLTSSAKFDIINIINVPLDPEDRGWQNLLKLMMEDGIFNFLPKMNDGWIDYLNPLLQLARKEKKFLKEN